MKRAILITLIGMLVLACSNDKKPNIIYIYTDQQSETMMSCAGNEYLETPAMDYIASNGIRFTRAYTTNPVCSPARVSMMTGRFPGYFSDNDGNQVRDNWAMEIPEVSEEVKATTIAVYLKKAGYDLVYGGKEHLPPSLTPGAMGFTDITDDERDVLSEAAARYIKGEHKDPYFMIVSLINPHDICYMAIASLLDRREFRRSAREEYTEEQWRMHRWAYARLTEMVDAQIQLLLDALKESGQEENTLVLFSSDHGDMDASHRMEHKTALYEEAANIPFAAMWRGHIPAGQVNNKNLVSNGLDLLPTVCDYAGIKTQADSRGRSLKSLFEGKNIEWRKTLAVESEIGRMIVSEDGYKYVRYDAVGTEERLMDLNQDPYEKTHFTNKESHSEVLEKLRKAFDEEWFPDL